MKSVGFTYKSPITYLYLFTVQAQAQAGLRLAFTLHTKQEAIMLCTY